MKKDYTCWEPGCTRRAPVPSDEETIPSRHYCTLHFRDHLWDGTIGKVKRRSPPEPKHTPPPAVKR